MSKQLTALTKDYPRSMNIVLVSVAIVLPLVCGYLFVLLTLTNPADQDDTGMMWLLPAAVGLFFLIFFGAGLSTFFLVLRRPANWLKLDAVFAPLGLTGRPYLMFSRQYHGVASGRKVDVYLARGPMLSLHVETPLSTRLNIGQASRTGQTIARTFGREPMATPDPGLDGLVIYAEDEAWATTFVTQPEVQALLRRLVLGESHFLFQQVHLQKGSFLLRFYRSKGFVNLTIQPEEARHWLDDLLALATIAESLPPPQPLN